MNPVVLNVQGLVKRFGGLTATDHASLAVSQGEIHALIGPNGAGKTTLIHQISGALRPDAGNVVFNGADMGGLPMHERALKGLVRSYQITSVFKRLSVLDNLALAVQAVDGSSMRFWHAARTESARFAAAASIAQRAPAGGGPGPGYPTETAVAG
jgi:branched-chain amino acid transport system ATP-binding protein